MPSFRSFAKYPILIRRPDFYFRPIFCQDSFPPSLGLPTLSIQSLIPEFLQSLNRPSSVLFDIISARGISVSFYERLPEVSWDFKPSRERKSSSNPSICCVTCVLKSCLLSVISLLASSRSSEFRCSSASACCSLLYFLISLGIRSDFQGLKDRSCHLLQRASRPRRRHFNAMRAELRHESISYERCIVIRHLS